MKSARTPAALGLVGIAASVLVLGLIGGVGAGWLSRQAGLRGTIATAVLMALVLGAGVGVSALWWRRLDEAAREAHKWAWYWGGSLGMVVGLVGVLTLSARAVDISPLFRPDMRPVDLIVAGMMSILVFQIVGYALAWAWWWLGRMRG